MRSSRRLQKLIRGILVYFLVSLIATHLTDGILQHGVLLIEVVDSLLALGIVMHRRLQEETEEALCAVASRTGGEVAEQTEVETERRSEDGVAAEEINLDLHGITHPAEDVDIVPTLFVVVAWGIVVDAYLMVILGVLVVAVSIEVRLYIGFQDGLEGGEFRYLLRAEVGRLVEYQSVAVTENIGGEPSAETQSTGANDRCKT